MAASSATADDLAPLVKNGEAEPCPAPDPDAARMLEVAIGSEAAFTELVHRHQNSLLNFFVRMGASSDGEDLVQETFVRLFRYRQKYQPTARFRTFLYHVARRVWADRARKILRFERLTTDFSERGGNRRPRRAGAAR